MLLIHLVSEQTLQNLLPTLALRPEAILQVRSSDARFASIPGHLEDACRKAGLNSMQFLPVVTIPSASPSIEETESVLNEIRMRQDANTLCVNLTGGTKLMSIGAYRFAEYHRLASLYTDTQNRRAFADAATAPWPQPLPLLPETVDQLTVPVVMAAQGKTFSEDTISEAMLDFGRRAWDLRTEHHEAISAWTEKIRESVPRSNNGKVTNNPQDLKTFLTKPLPSATSEAASDYLDAAADAGLLRVDLSGRTFLATQASKTDIERTMNLLDGAWLELAVAAFARRGTRFADVHWSIMPESAGDAADYGETDLVLLDRKKLRLAIISCKSSLKHLSKLEHLSSWRDRARTLGGSYAAVHLAVFQASDPSEVASMKKLGKAMGISVHVGDEIRSFFSE